ncbi:MnhB domain-containing protein [Caldimonas caldifontis]|jgi:multicomponent Na+:H+ antiporter subunit B|uniref:Na(+)/H(+) antiporter subunit B n=1 Tax=Caldimonas caldifontis TaxID=1452508 RepID=A0A2S5STV1_9BURK|nr:MnhB domain-containing protein [Caldimonas caldifontis]PPE66139.1 Na(+)/H(+) antiporter subunit B [Caldimonas caldifontis]
MNPRIVILDVVARVLYWVILAASIWVLLRGHNEPGGGFIGALVAVSASVLWGIARSPAEAARRLPTGSAVGLAALGVLLAGLSGLPAVWQGQAFLTHWWGSLNLGFTEFKISTVLLFDIGVYLCVWGALAGYALALIDIDEPLSKDSKETRS